MANLVEPIDEAVTLTPEEEAGLEEAIDAIEAGERGLTPRELRESLRTARKR